MIYLCRIRPCPTTTFATLRRHQLWLYWDSSALAHATGTRLRSRRGRYGSWRSSMKAWRHRTFDLIDRDNVVEPECQPPAARPNPATSAKQKLPLARTHYTNQSAMRSVWNWRLVIEDNLRNVEKAFWFRHWRDRPSASLAMAACAVGSVTYCLCLSGGAGVQKNPALIQNRWFEPRNLRPFSFANLRCTLRNRCGFLPRYESKNACRACSQPKISCRRNRARRVLPMPHHRSNT